MILYQTAHQNLKKFVKEFSDVYGEDHVVHNIHGLIHLKDDVLAHGSLDKFSAFKFENFMQTILKDIRKPSQILQQLGNRSKEKSTFPKKNLDKDFKPKINHKGPIYLNCAGLQYSSFKHKDFIIDTKSLGDSCLLRIKLLLLKPLSNKKTHL